MAKKNAKNKFKFKWTKELIFLIVGIVALIVATVVLSIPSSASRKTEVFNNAITEYNTANSTSYTLIPDENVFTYVNNIDEMLSLAGNDGYVYIFYGLLTDGTTLENLSAINTAAQASEISTVYFFEATWVSENADDTEEYESELQANDDRFNTGKNITGEFTLANYPAILIYNSGSLEFCTQEYDENTSYTWTMYINQAFNKFVTEE